MPTYDYRCDVNDQVVEVSHRMSETIANWGDLCARAGVDLGETPADAPVHRLATGGNLISKSSLGSGMAPPPPAAPAAAVPRGCAASDQDPRRPPSRVTPTSSRCPPRSRVRTT